MFNFILERKLVAEKECRLFSAIFLLWRYCISGKANWFQTSEHTVPKALSMHEPFPKLPGKSSKTTWKY
jgi:hypothetical protein